MVMHYESSLLLLTPNIPGVRSLSSPQVPESGLQGAVVFQQRYLTCAYDLLGSMGLVNDHAFSKGRVGMHKHFQA